MSRTTRFQILVVLRLPTFDFNFASLLGFNSIITVVIMAFHNNIGTFMGIFIEKYWNDKKEGVV